MANAGAGENQKKVQYRQPPPFAGKIERGKASGKENSYYGIFHRFAFSPRNVGITVLGVSFLGLTKEAKTDKEIAKIKVTVVESPIMWDENNETEFPYLATLLDEESHRVALEKEKQVYIAFARPVFVKKGKWVEINFDIDFADKDWKKLMGKDRMPLMTDSLKEQFGCTSFTSVDKDVTIDVIRSYMPSQLSTLHYLADFPDLLKIKPTEKKKEEKV